MLAAQTHVRTHVWSPTLAMACDEITGAVWSDGAQLCTTRYLTYAYEPRDYVGNSDALCEGDNEQSHATDSICLFNRNRGAYPGGDFPFGGYPAGLQPEDGSLVQFDDGGDEGVAVPGFGRVYLWGYVTNGE
jgi:hypothetical protein